MDFGRPMRRNGPKFWDRSLQAIALLAVCSSRKGSVRAFPPGADAGWSHIGGPWFFSTDCRTSDCDVTLPFEPAVGPGDNKIALYNRNTYREFQAMFEFRRRGAGSSAGFVFGRVANNSGSFLALEFPFDADNVVILSRHRPGNVPQILANVSLPGLPATSKLQSWHTVEPVSYTHLTLPTILRV